jgi:hypothetical protein
MLKHLLVLAVITTGCSALGASPYVGKIEWEKDTAKGLEKIQADNGKAMLYFTAEW